MFRIVIALGDNEAFIKQTEKKPGKPKEAHIRRRIRKVDRENREVQWQILKTSISAAKFWLQEYGIGEWDLAREIQGKST